MHFAYMKVVSGTPDPTIAQAMFEGQQHSALATVTKTDEREYAQFVAAAALQNKKEPGLGLKKTKNKTKAKAGGGGGGGGGGAKKNKRWDECDHCGSWDHSQRDCPWHKLSPREAKTKRLDAQADKRGYNKGRR